MHRLRIAAAAAAVAIALGGCAQAPSTAATVDGQTISTREVDRTAHALQQQGLQIPAGTVLSVQMRAVAAQHIANRQGMRLEQDAQALVGQLGFSPDLLATPEGRQIATDIAKVESLTLRLGKGPTNAALGAIPVQVNPRYGVRGLEDVASGTASLSNGSLSQPAAE